ncbi:MAG: hypothetical protein JW751_23295 [Polyangiaceae bacterium]|nr:hypothetical protein [Polyangiaceae bacterium]
MRGAGALPTGASVRMDWRGLGGQAQALEDGADYGWLGDPRDQPSLHAAMGACEGVDVEDPEQELGPGTSAVAFVVLGRG